MTLCRETPAAAHARPRNTHMYVCHWRVRKLYEARMEHSESHSSIFIAGWGGYTGFRGHRLSAQYSARVRMVCHVLRIRRIEARLATCLAFRPESAHVFVGVGLE